MDLEQLKLKWIEQDAKLDMAVRLNLRLVMLADVRPRVRRTYVLEGASALATLAVSFFLLNFAFENRASLHYALAAGMLAVLTIALLIAQVRLMVAASELNYSAPVTVLRRKIEEMRILRIRTVRWILTLSMLAFTPMLLVAMKVLFNVDAWQVFDRVWLISHAVLGVAMIPLSVWIARRFKHRLPGFARELAGTDLNAAMDSLASLAEF